MTFKDINIRDPFVLPFDGKYYLYGTRGETAWRSATGLDVYVSDDLETWSEAHECFSVPEGFWANKEVWRLRCIITMAFFICLCLLSRTADPEVLRF